MKGKIKMLQELTENDFNRGINKAFNKKKLLATYNYFRQYQEEEFKDYYYDDNFYWSTDYLLKSMRYSSNNSMVNGCQMYRYKPEWKIDNDVIQDMFDKIKPSDKYTLRKYINIILNKLRPTEEYYNNVIRPQLEKHEEKTLEQISGEQFEKYMDEKKANNIENKRIVLSDAYIYRIIVDGKIVYIGKTTRPIKKRIEEHIECALNPNINNSQQNYLYKAMRSCQGYRFEIVYESHGLITNRELEELEKAMIEGFKPEFNYEGVKVPYRFSDEK